MIGNLDLVSKSQLLLGKAKVRVGYLKGNLGAYKVCMINIGTELTANRRSFDFFPNI